MSGPQQITACVLGSLETLNRELAALQADAGSEEGTKRPRRRRSSAPMSPNSEALAPPPPHLGSDTSGDKARGGDGVREARLVRPDLVYKYGLYLLQQHKSSLANEVWAAISVLLVYNLFCPRPIASRSHYWRPVSLGGTKRRRGCTSSI